MLLLALLACAGGPDEETATETADPCEGLHGACAEPVGRPDFTAYAPDGDERTWGDLNGHWSLLLFDPDGADLAAYAVDFPIAVVGVNFDTAEQNAALGLPFEVWSDPFRELSLHYGAATFAGQPSPDRRAVLLDDRITLRVVYDPTLTPELAREDVERLR